MENNMFSKISETFKNITDKSIEKLIFVKKQALIGLGYENELNNVFFFVKEKEFKKALTEILNLQQKLRELNTGAVLLNILNETEKEIEILNQNISETRSEIRTLKTELTSDNRLPSIEMIEKRIKLRNRLDLYRRRYEELFSYQEEFKNLSDEWTRILGKEKEIPASLSPFDYKKISSLEQDFKLLLKEFHYRSKPIESISISRETLLPVVDKYSLKFDSSASDFTRAIWSYIIALKETSTKFSGNHPKLFILDEPGQQEAGDNDLQFLLKKLGNYQDTQSIVFSSFHQSEETFIACTQNVNYKLVDLGTEKFIKRIEN